MKNDLTRPSFHSTLEVVKLKEAPSDGRAVWRLVQDLIFWSPTFGIFTAPKGFTTDFASVPRLPIIYWLTGDTAHASAVIHDYLCRTRYRLSLMSWADCALVFKEAMRAERVPRWRAWAMFTAVRLFGEPKNTPPRNH